MIDTARGWRIWLRHGELTRPVDRIQAVVLMAVLITGMVFVPIALAVGSETYASQVRLGQEQNRTRQQVTATLLRDAPAASGGHGAPPGGPAKVPARWVAPDGTPHTGKVTAAHGTKSGSVVTVWLDGRGKPVPEPATREQAAMDGIAMAMGLYLAAAAALCTIYLLVRAALNRARTAAWQREWARVGPEWTHTT